jgi:ribosome-associated toxin RatA of RatAB toxin-antitoxin module
LGQVETTGKINTAWEVLTDYDNFERFLPNIASSKIITAKGDRILFEQVNVVDLWLIKQKFTVQIEAIKTKPNKIDFKIVDGDLKKLVGRWQISTTSPGKIIVSQAVEVEPENNTEKSFFYGVYESSLAENLKAIAKEITKRSNI